MNWWTLAKTAPLILKNGHIATEPLKIAAKALAELALPNHCPACWWMKHRLKNSFPFQIPPALLTKMDAIEKRYCHSRFDHGAPPPWLQWGHLTGYLPVGRDFHHAANGVLIRGIPDDIFTHRRGLKIIDYKTSKFKGSDDIFYEQYVHQLNFYAFIAEAKGLGKVTDLALGYVSLEPEQADIDNDDFQSDSRLLVPFDFHLLEVPLVSRRALMRLVREGKAIAESEQRPSGNAGCENCARVEAMCELTSSRISTSK